MSALIEGNVGSGKAGFDKNKFVVQAVRDGKILSNADVGKDGGFAIKLDDAEIGTGFILRLCFVSEKLPKPTNLQAEIAPTMFAKVEGGVAKGKHNFRLSDDLLGRIIDKHKKKYRIHGEVYSKTAEDDFTPRPGLKIIFYEVDPLTAPFPRRRAQRLGETYSGAGGEYEFKFAFSDPMDTVFADLKPDIKAKIYQWSCGSWHLVFESVVSWNIAEDFSKDYIIPDENLLPPSPTGVQPATGFHPISAGLLPIDHTRISGGYATARAGDPARITGLRHQPFCGTLRIFGMFQAGVVKYKVMITPSDALESTGAWEELTDPLTNRKWDAVTRTYVAMPLGPDSGNFYTSIDSEPPLDWHEHTLRFEWMSANKPDGFYRLKFVGCNAGGGTICEEILPAMRIDNSAPEAGILAVRTHLGPVGSPCGEMELPKTPAMDRWLECEVTAHDPNGHMLSYQIYASGGNPGVSIGSLSEDRGAADTWDGVYKAAKSVMIGSPAELASCGSYGASLSLVVQGAATDCYAPAMSSQRVDRVTNLAVTEV